MPYEVVERFATRYLLTLGHGVPREIAAMATAMVAAVGGRAWEHVEQEKLVKEGQSRNMSKISLLVGAVRVGCVSITTVAQFCCLDIVFFDVNKIFHLSKLFFVSPGS